jgi:hypothetical protein
LAQRWFLIRAINAYDPRLSGVGENSQSGTSFPESGTSFPESGTSLEDVIKHHASGPHLDGNKCNLLPWNLAALCQRCHREAQWVVDFY